MAAIRDDVEFAAWTLLCTALDSHREIGMHTLAVGCCERGALVGHAYEGWLEAIDPDPQAAEAIGSTKLRGRLDKDPGSDLPLLTRIEFDGSYPASIAAGKFSSISTLQAVIVFGTLLLVGALSVSLLLALSGVAWAKDLAVGSIAAFVLAMQTAFLTTYGDAHSIASRRQTRRQQNRAGVIWGVSSFCFVAALCVIMVLSDQSASVMTAGLLTVFSAAVSAAIFWWSVWTRS